MKQRLAQGYAIDIQPASPTPESGPIPNSAYYLGHPSNVYVRAFAQSQILMTERVAFSTKWPLREFWKDRVRPHRAIADAYVEPIINAALERRRRKEAVGQGEEGKLDGEHETYLSHLVEATDGAFVPVFKCGLHPKRQYLADKEVIRDSVFNILVAGRDTVREFNLTIRDSDLALSTMQTAATLTFAVYMLAEHPDITERLQKEILDVVGSSRMPTYDDVQSMIGIAMNGYSFLGFGFFGVSQACQ
ncbi:hypothetical protein MVEN_01692600 [Mycena venus]|uniref:Cytochrome P450 n=1 Tax=Mycena venus TaxID=2733690 RepID=A0A8H6XPC2_9AGAR|nr:hypothetical protein MVEN_01692600 [Mycena venus]